MQGVAEDRQISPPKQTQGRCRLCRARVLGVRWVCDGCAERLELELDQNPHQACSSCGRHRELCALSPCAPPLSDVPFSNAGRHLVWLSLSEIVETPAANNSRRHYDPAAISELAQSIREYGLLQPLCVRSLGQQYQLVFGVRRYRAAILAELREVPCTLITADDLQAFLINILENLQRQQLSGADRIRAIQRLTDSGWGVREISRRTGFDPSTISRWLRIDRNPLIRSAVEQGTLDITRAKILVECPRAALVPLLDQAQRLTASELRAEVAAQKRISTSPAVANSFDDEQHLLEALAHLRAVRCNRGVSEKLLADVHAQIERITSLSLTQLPALVGHNEKVADRSDR